MADIREIPLFKVSMTEEAITRASEVLRSGYIGQGAVVEEFEKELSNYFQINNLLTTNSATSALHLALHLIKGDERDEVLTTPLTCTATNFPILANGYKIKWVDINPRNLNIDLDDLARKINSKTKAVMIVHWGGYPVDLIKLDSILDKAYETYGYRPIVIEDCAHAMGSNLYGKMIGTHGNFCSFSLQAIKHVTSVDGGILVTPTHGLYKRAKLLRWYGIDREGDRTDFRCEVDVPEYGFKFHMNDVCAAVGVENFKKMNPIVVAHKMNGFNYDMNLRNVGGVTLLERTSGFNSSYWIYSLLVEDKLNFAKAMKSRGVATSQVHERNDIHTCTKDYKSILPNLDNTIPKLTAIPVGWWITDEDREYVIESIKKGW